MLESISSKEYIYENILKNKLDEAILNKNGK